MKRVSLILAAALRVAPAPMKAMDEKQLAGAVLSTGLFGLATLSAYLNYKLNFSKPGEGKLHEKLLGTGTTLVFGSAAIQVLYDTLTNFHLDK